jgi:glutaminase
MVREPVTLPSSAWGTTKSNQLWRRSVTARGKSSSVKVIWRILFFLLATGLVSVRLRLGAGGWHKRLSTITPGLAFGELALLDSGTRSADVVADEPSVCYLLRTARLNELTVSHPEIRTKLILNIGRELSARLRQADAEIRSLAE